jgi:hypothetical protein
MTGTARIKARLRQWLGERRCRKIAYAGWLTSALGPQPNPSLRSVDPRLGSRALLFGYHAWRGEFRIPGRMYVPIPAIAKARAIRWHARRHGLRYFVETGTYLGDTMAAVADQFERCWTIELSTDLHERARRRFAGTNIECLQGDSSTSLRNVVAALPGPALFWLDAHASGGITADAGHDPTIAELEAIFPTSAGHVVLIDDASGQSIEVVRRKAGAGYACILKNDILRLVPGSLANE